MKDMVSMDAAAVGQYNIGQVMYPGTSTPPTHPSSANHQQPPTRVAMAPSPAAEAQVPPTNAVPPAARAAALHPDTPKIDQSDRL